MNKVKWLSCFVLSIVLLLVPKQSEAQENILFKVGVNKLFNRQFFVGTQFKCFEPLSINIELGALKKAYYMETIDKARAIGEIRTNQTKNGSVLRHRTNALTGYQANIEARYHPGKDMSEGLYLGVKTGYQYVDFGPLEVSLYKVEVLDGPTYTKDIIAQQQSWFLGGTFGFNAKITKNLILDTNVFSGYMYTELIDPEALSFVPYAEPGHNIFRSNHRIPIDQFRMELNMFLSFRFD